MFPVRAIAELPYMSMNMVARLVTIDHQAPASNSIFIKEMLDPSHSVAGVAIRLVGMKNVNIWIR